MIHLLGECIGMGLRAGIVRRPPPAMPRHAPSGAAPALFTIRITDDNPTGYATLCRISRGTMMVSFGPMAGRAGHPPAIQGPRAGHPETRRPDRTLWLLALARTA